MQTEKIELENPGIPLRQGYEVWNDSGELVLRTISQAAMWRRRPAYFRVAETGKIYAAYSREHTEEVAPGLIRWRPLRGRLSGKQAVGESRGRRIAS